MRNVRALMLVSVEIKARRKIFDQFSLIRKTVQTSKAYEIELITHMFIYVAEHIYFDISNLFGGQ